jgi:hypothetical protein
VLFRFPAHQLARLLFLHALDLDFLDDHVATADGGDDVTSLDTALLQRHADRVRHDAGVHDLALDDGIRQERRDDDARELRLAATVVDDRDLDES